MTDLIYVGRDVLDSEAENLFYKAVCTIENEPNRIATVIRAIEMMVVYVLNDHPRAINIIENMNARLMAHFEEQTK